MIDPHKPKYHDLYWEIAYAAARQSVATRAQVGAVVVTTTGMLSIGWNGMPAGLTNQCENREAVDEHGIRYLKTDPRVIHAERNAIDKMTRQGVPTEGALLFTTLEPCLECAKAICGLGFKGIYYKENHDCHQGSQLLRSMNIPVHKV